MYILDLICVFCVYCLVMYLFVCMLLYVLLFCDMVLVISIGVGIFRNTSLFCFCIFWMCVGLVWGNIEVFGNFSLSPLGHLCHWMNLPCLACVSIQGRPWFC